MDEELKKAVDAACGRLDFWKISYILWSTGDLPIVAFAALELPNTEPVWNTPTARAFHDAWELGRGFGYDERSGTNDLAESIIAACAALNWGEKR